MGETVAEKPAFKEALRQRRCLIPAEGFYEWQRHVAGRKQPFNIGLADGSLFAFAGWWDSWLNPATGASLETCTVITTTPNALVSEVHDRMPVILRPEDYDLWLDREIRNPARVLPLLAPFDSGAMRKYPVSQFVNRVENEGPECAREVAVEAAQQRLFGG
jgi:putative SOS response-associated peptidase YedK